MRVLSAGLQPTGGETDNPAKARWAEAVRDNVMRLSADLGSVATGRHVLKIWRIDDNMILQKLVLATVPMPQTYLGPA